MSTSLRSQLVRTSAAFPSAAFVSAAFTLAAFTLADPASSQICPDFGSQPVAAAIEAAPTSLGCNGAPGWPSWHLLTPAHREPMHHVGFTPGHAREVPRILVAYACTGWLVVPVLPVHVRTMGYVIDQPEEPCS